MYRTSTKHVPNAYRTHTKGKFGFFYFGLQKGYVFSQNEWPTWAITDMWAPEIHYVNDGYLVYFSAKHKETGYHTIGVAISANKTNPLGPYYDFGKPLIEDSNGVIDAHWFKDPK